MTRPAETHRFSIRARHVDAHHARLLEDISFEAAAVAYLDDLPVEAGDHEEISLIVRDIDSGHEHCFRIDLTTGETAPCG